MNLIDSVAENVEAHFKKLWPYQDQGEFIRSREIAKEGEYFRSLAKLSEQERQERLAQGLEKDDASYKSPALQAEIEKASAKLLSAEEQSKLFKETGYAISDELNRLTPSTYPKDDPETPKKMVEFLTKFSKSYTKEGKQRSAGPILEYLLAADYDWAFWLWGEWISACLAVDDHTSAEALIAAATDGSTPASTHFAQRGGPYKPKIMVAKAMIALRRDGDLDLAHQISNAARLNFGESYDAIQAFRGIEYLRQEVDAKRLTIAMNTGKNGGKVHELVDTRVPANALLTGKWEKDEE